MAYSKVIYGQISMLQKLRPAKSPTDHLFIGTSRFQYFTAAWNPQSRQVDTVQSFVDVSEKHMRDSQSLDRCLVDPTGQYLVMELFEGVLNLVKVMKPRKGIEQYLDQPEQVRITELFIRSSTFLYTETKSPKLALLYQDAKEKVRLVTYRVTDEKGRYSQFDANRDRENDIENLDPGACGLIPVPKGEEEQKRYIYRNAASAKAQLGGVIVVGETRMTYLDDESMAIVEYALDEASIFVAWERYDTTRYLLADEYGWLHLLTIEVDGAVVTGMNVKRIGEISKPSALVYLGNEVLYIASHEGDSQVVRLDLVDLSREILQTMPNIAPILDFTIMDMGSQDGGKSNEYSSGQARIVTGSGAFQDGSLRSVRSGVGLEDICILDEMENVRALFPLETDGSGVTDTLAVSFLTETRIFCFDCTGEVEEMDDFLGMVFDERTILAMVVSNGRILQITPSKVLILDTDSGITISSWQPSNSETITTAAANESWILLSTEGRELISLDLRADLSQVGHQDLGDKDQVACLHVPSQFDVGLVGLWQSGSVSILRLPDLKAIHSEALRPSESAAIPRDIVLAQILPEDLSGPTLLVAMSDGIVLTFTVERDTYLLSIKKSVILGIQHARFQIIAKPDGLFNVFTTCEHSSLIYGSEGRIVYSAVTAEDATCICPFNSKAFPDAIVIATASQVKISQIETERRTHVRTLPVRETVRRIAYSASEKVFGIGAIKRELRNGEEIITSSFRLVDEVAFGDLGKSFILNNKDGIEIIECVIRAELPNTYGEPVERFIVGSSFLSERQPGLPNGRIRVFGVGNDRSPFKIHSHDLKGSCRCLAVLGGKIVAALVKTVVMYSYIESSTSSAALETIASYRTSTCPVDLDITGNIIAVADLMKSISLVEYIPGEDGVKGELVEVARHLESSWSTAVANIDTHTYLQSDGDGNLTVLQRNIAGLTPEDRRKLDVTCEMNLGEMVNKIRKVDVETTSNTLLIPKAFLATVSSIYPLYITFVLNTFPRLRDRSTSSQPSSKAPKISLCAYSRECPSSSIASEIFHSKNTAVLKVAIVRLMSRFGSLTERWLSGS
jgi:DNA damage-binding protein 1